MPPRTMSRRYSCVTQARLSARLFHGIQARHQQAAAALAEMFKQRSHMLRKRCSGDSLKFAVECRARPVASTCFRLRNVASPPKRRIPATPRLVERSSSCQSHLAPKSPNGPESQRHRWVVGEARWGHGYAVVNEEISGVGSQDRSTVPSRVVWYMFVLSARASASVPLSACYGGKKVGSREVGRRRYRETPLTPAGVGSAARWRWREAGVREANRYRRASVIQVALGAGYYLCGHGRRLTPVSSFSSIRRNARAYALR